MHASEEANRRSTYQVDYEMNSRVISVLEGLIDCSTVFNMSKYTDVAPGGRYSLRIGHRLNDEGVVFDEFYERLDRGVSGEVA